MFDDLVKGVVNVNGPLRYAPYHLYETEDTSTGFCRHARRAEFVIWALPFGTSHRCCKFCESVAKKRGILPRKWEGVEDG